jgi:hypothetical protein
MQLKMIIPLKMPKAHAAGIFNGLANNKEVTAQILCGDLFLRCCNKKTLPATADSAKPQKGKRDRP